jgi:hypothetical protein
MNRRLIKDDDLSHQDWNSHTALTKKAFIILLLLTFIAVVVIVIINFDVGHNATGCFNWLGVYYCPGDCLEQEGAPNGELFYCPDSRDERPMLMYDYTINQEAICNDGTPAKIHYRNYLGEENQHNWIFRFEGGNLCYDAETCAQRANGPEAAFMSAPTRPIIYQDPLGGVLNGDPAKNPSFHGWNAVHVHYCSSDLYTGDSAAAHNDLGFAHKIPFVE